MERKNLRRKFKLTTIEKTFRQLRDVKSIEPLFPEGVSLEESIGYVLIMHKHSSY